MLQVWSLVPLDASLEALGREVYNPLSFLLLLLLLFVLFALLEGAFFRDLRD